MKETIPAQWFDILSEWRPTFTGSAAEEVDENWIALPLPSASLNVAVGDFKVLLLSRLREAQAPRAQRRTVYVWRDKMAGQLRVGAISGDDVASQFGCTVAVVAIEEVVAPLASTSGHGGFIPWNELEEVDFDSAELEKEDAQFTLNVGVQTVGD